MKLYNIILENDVDISENAALKKYITQTIGGLTDVTVSGLKKMNPRLGSDLETIVKSRPISGVKNADELVNALKSGNVLKPAGMGDLIVGSLKTNGVSDDFIRATVPMWVNDPRFLTAWTQTNKPLTKKALMSKGYTDNAANEIIKYAKTNTKFQNALKAGGYKPTVRDKNLINTKPPVTPPKVPGGWKTVKEMLDKLKLKWGWKKMISWAAGLGISTYALWYLINKYGGSDIPSDMPSTAPSIWSTCIENMIKSGMGQEMTSEDGTKSVIIKDQKYPNGITFYENGTMKDNSTNKKGKWRCKEGDIQERKTYSMLKIVLEQEDEETQMGNDVGKMIRLLDFPVTRKNIINATSLLKKYHDSNLGNEFLSLYKDSGYGGGDITKTLKYIKAFNPNTVIAKRKLEELVNSILSGKTSQSGQPQTSTGSSSNIDDNVHLDWDGGQSGSSYFDCEDWDINTKPYKIGCRSSKIREIQKCLGLNPDGAFGPATQKALIDIEVDMTNGITSEVYNRVMKSCNNSSAETTPEPETTTEPEVSTEPETTTEPEVSTGVQPIEYGETQYSGQVETGEEFFNRLNNNNLFNRSFRRVRYKNAPLSKEDYDKLNQYFSTMGYYPIKAKEKGEEEFKYVWAKTRRRE